MLKSPEQLAAIPPSLDLCAAPGEIIPTCSPHFKTKVNLAPASTLDHGLLSLNFLIHWEKSISSFCLIDYEETKAQGKHIPVGIRPDEKEIALKQIAATINGEKLGDNATPLQKKLHELVFERFFSQFSDYREP